jgi:DNA/RNA-binding domain of Phe-tRNA-synthetase-like protein
MIKRPEFISFCILNDLKNLEKLGYIIPAKAYDLASNLEIVKLYISPKLQISDLAEVFIDLSKI